MHGLKETVEDIPQLDLDIGDLATLGERMSMISLEYLRYMYRLNDLSPSELERVENIEAFFGEIFMKLDDEDYMSVHLHHTVFTTIKVQYRLPHLLDMHKRAS